MTQPSWYAHATVATIVKQDDAYLMVYEKTQQGNRYNQPAGHLEAGESLIEAAIRETKEETKWLVEPTHLVRVNQFKAPTNGNTYLRITLAANPVQFLDDALLDSDIIKPIWMTKSDILNHKEQLRSPLVLSDILFYEQHKPLPLDYIHCHSF